MAVVYVDLDAQYAVKTTDQPVTLEVTIGNGQSGAYSIFLGTAYKGSNVTVPLGIKADLVGKQTLVVVTVRDVLTETNWTSMTVKLHEGGNTTTLGPYSKQVPLQKDTAIYTLSIANS